MYHQKIRLTPVLDHRSGVYELSEAEGVQRGTKIVIHLKGECYDYCKEEIIKGEFQINYNGKFVICIVTTDDKLDRVKRIWYLLPMRAAKVQASLRIRAVSPEPSLLTHTSSESRGTFRQKARSLAPLNGWACAVKICHDGMLVDTNSLDGAQLQLQSDSCLENEFLLLQFPNFTVKR